ncbi:MAG: 5-methyltetrahydropteroyltriglutamate--homocysteine S-methyltransferase [Acetobacteraceae bacterium]|nr:5-methyltetrahydropteroyltriglutamate--homocysteine S-methyltransferase [Acetobacteraceae bacterium]
MSQPVRTRPPFRADHVGSLLRPVALREARAKRVLGELSAEVLREIENACIVDAIKKQESIGLRASTDGEYRRAYWHYDFISKLDGVELVTPKQDVHFSGGTLLPKSLEVHGKVGYSHPIMVDDFKFVASHVTTSVAKQTIPSPSVLHFRGGRQAIDRAIYPELDGFFTDLGNAYKGAVSSFADAGCRYLQLDEVNIAYLCDPAQIEGLKARGEHVDGLLQEYGRMINTAIDGRPEDMAISMHLCRGNFKSTWFAAGGYEPVADVLFNQINVDAYFMEYDTDRAGGFEPLRLLPKGHKVVVLGIMTSKTGELETADFLKRRIEEAAKYAPLEQLAISPQCGFASTEEGNTLSEDQQWKKLELLVKVAEDVWGSV